MSGSKRLSNRHRKGQQQRVASTPQVEPQGIVAREAVREQVIGRIMLQRGADLAVAVAIGNLSEAEVKAELSIETVGGVDMVSSDRRGDRHAGTGLRVRGDDGLVALYRSGAISDVQVKAGLAYRLCYDLAAAALGSCLGRVGEGRGARDWSGLSVGTNDDGQLVALFSKADLHRSYVIARLTQLERAVCGVPDPDGHVWIPRPSDRSLNVLRHVAGEGRSLREATGCGGKAAMLQKAALVDALDVIGRVLRIGEQLGH